MKKWADYLISAMRITEGTNTKLTAYFKVHQDKGDYIGAGVTWTKEEVLEAMKNGEAFLTIYKENNGKWKKGFRVQEIAFSHLFKRLDEKKEEKNHTVLLPEF